MPTSTARLGRITTDRHGPGPQGTGDGGRHRPFIVAVLVAASVTALALLALGPPRAALAQTEPGGTTSPTGGTLTTDAPTDTVDPAVVAQLQTGSEVFSQICSACHQPGGAGLAGQFPPLKGNPNVQDAVYVAGVINNGKQGPLTVLGETYNGVMPSFSTLSDDDVTAVIAYIQNDFQVPAGAVTAAPAGPVAGTELPALTNMSALVAYLLAAAVIGLVLAPRLLSANDRLNVPWLDAWLKTAVIVLSVILFTVVIPNWALKNSAVTKLSRIGQDVIGLGLWSAGMAAVLWALWYAHRESRV